MNFRSNDFWLVWFVVSFVLLDDSDNKTKEIQIKLVWNHFDLKFILTCNSRVVVVHEQFRPCVCTCKMNIIPDILLDNIWWPSLREARSRYLWNFLVHLVNATIYCLLQYIPGKITARLREEDGIKWMPT